MTIENESNTFEIFLNALVQDFGGKEIFDEDNESRLNKAIKSLADSFAQEKKWMLIACMENIPQKLYSVIEFPPEAQQRMIDICLKELSSLGLTPLICENVVSGFIRVLKLKGSTAKEPEIEKVLGEEEIAGDSYKTCKIGNQIWMAENLRTKHRENGLDIAAPGNKYGRLYTYCGAQLFYDAGSPLFKKNGWHLPTIEDWLELVSFIESLEVDSGAALKSKKDWGGDADSGLDLFGFAAHPIKFWDDNLPPKREIKRYPNSTSWPEKSLNEQADRDEVANQYIEISTVSNFPCVQFWTNTNYVDNPHAYIPGADYMTYVATLVSSKNELDLDKGKISTTGRTNGRPPYGFACVRFVKDAD